MSEAQEDLCVTGPIQCDPDVRHATPGTAARSSPPQHDARWVECIVRSFANTMLGHTCFPQGCLNRLRGTPRKRDGTIISTLRSTRSAASRGSRA
jgi:hypothetical protein